MLSHQSENNGGHEEGKFVCKTYELIAGYKLTICRFSSGYVSISTNFGEDFALSECKDLDQTLNIISETLAEIRQADEDRLLAYLECLQKHQEGCIEPHPTDISDLQTLYDQLFDIWSDWCSNQLEDSGITIINSY